MLVVSTEYLQRVWHLKQGTLIIPDTWFRRFSGLPYAPIVETSFPERAVPFLDFSLCISLGTFSILLIKRQKKSGKRK